MGAKNCKIAFTFVKVIQGKLYRSFFPDTVYEVIAQCSACADPTLTPVILRKPVNSVETLSDQKNLLHTFI